MNHFRLNSSGSLIRVPAKSENSTTIMISRRFCHPACGSTGSSMKCFHRLAVLTLAYSREIASALPRRFTLIKKASSGLSPEVIRSSISSRGGSQLADVGFSKVAPGSQMIARVSGLQVKHHNPPTSHSGIFIWCQNRYTSSPVLKNRSVQTRFCRVAILPLLLLYFQLLQSTWSDTIILALLDSDFCQ